jgi:3-isopropylmalate dehydrogenase
VNSSEHLIGIFQGEGIGPEVSQAALQVLTALEHAHGGKHRFLWREGGPIGSLSISINGQPLDAEAISFCRQIFTEGGIILAGPGGDRFVYECRKEFGLYYKLNPLQPSPLPLEARRIKPEILRDVDIIVVRDNSGGIYQGDWRTETLPCGDRLAHQAFRYSESQVRSVAEIACDFALRRRGSLAIVTKPNGIPAVSQLWLECVRGIAERSNLDVQALEIDYAAFAMIQHPNQFDVVVTSNLFGDILSDIGGLLLGSRGLCYGASFSSGGAAIYQTNHGAAYDLAGQDRANPVGHLLALAMALEISFKLPDVAETLRRAIHSVWEQGWRTEDLAEPGGKTVGTQAMTELIVEAIRSA